MVGKGDTVLTREFKLGGGRVINFLLPAAFAEENLPATIYLPVLMDFFLLIFNIFLCKCFLHAAFIVIYSFYPLSHCSLLTKTLIGPKLSTRENCVVTIGKQYCLYFEINCGRPLVVQK